MGRFKHRKKHTSFGEAVVLALFGVAAFWLAVTFHGRGIPSKWVTATVETAASFGIVVYMHRRWLTRWTFWTAMLICFLVHCVLVFVFFQFVLRDFTRFSPLLWSPVMVFETFALLIAIAKLERKFGLDRKHIVRLTF